MAQHRTGVSGAAGQLPSSGPTIRLTRRRMLGGVAAAWAVGTARVFYPPPVGPAVEVVHWANGHMMNAALLPRFAEQFNQARHLTSTGKHIVVKLVLANSGTMADELIARTRFGASPNAALPNPTIVTPAADHWLPLVNHVVGQEVIDPRKAQVMAKTWIGIVTFREMAEAIGWPRREVGFADVVKLCADPIGWAGVRGARPDWGQQPLLSYTDPSTSSTGRSMLFALYSIGAGKPPEALTTEDIVRPDVVSYVKTFLRSVDHYVYDTLTLNSKIFQGPRYGHFFFVSESNLVQLYLGQLAVTVGTEVKAQPLTRQMVFIYPSEGAVSHNHSANVVQASWVTPEQAEAAQQWISFVREDAQQAALMGQGFRPATALALADPISGRYGLDPTKPTAIRYTDTMDPDVAEAIVGSWDDVKKPGIASFVVDVSGSMRGAPLDQAKEGLKRALALMSKGNSVGLLTFSDTIHSRVEVDVLRQNQYKLVAEVESMVVRGGTALYDAIRAGIEMADSAAGEPDAIRGVVVVTDGKANRGEAVMSDLVEMTSSGESRIKQFDGFEGGPDGIDENGGRVGINDIIGTGLALKTKHRIHIFFVGMGSAELNVGRILAEATNSAFRGATEKDLAEIIEQYGKYF